MTALARLTGGTKTVHQTSPPTKLENCAFPKFSQLPAEVRLQIWQQALPGPRIITHNSKHNRHITTLAVNHEARTASLSHLTPLLSPTFDTTRTTTEIIYANLDTDTIIRDIADPGIRDPFTLNTIELNRFCYRTFIGLAKVKHLAVAFDLLHDNGGQLFGPLQSCCPELETLTLFPSSMCEGGPMKHPRLGTNHKVKFLDIDSNLLDYVSFRWSQLHERKLNRKAIRGVAVLLTLHDHAQQYHNVFPDYIEHYGRNWKPRIRVCLMAKWNERCKGWQTRFLEGDRYSKGFQGEDGRMYRGFVESGMICGGDGEVLSRYDGVAEMFDGLELGK